MKKICKLFYTSLLLLTFSVLSNAQVNYTLISTDLTIKDGIIISCSYDFSTNTNGTNLTIPEGLDIKGIVNATSNWNGYVEGTAPFANKNIRYLKLPTTIVDIGDYAFRDNHFTSITLPPSLKRIGKEAFFRNNLQNDLNIPRSVTEIGASAFQYNTSLIRVNFATGSKLLQIHSNAFSSTQITSLNLPTPSIVTNNFENWIQLDGLNSDVPPNTQVSPNYGYIAKFDYTLQDQDVIVKNGIIIECTYNFESRFIIIPEKLERQRITGIASSTLKTDGLFYNKGIIELTLPPTLVTIGDNAFTQNNIKHLTLPPLVREVGAYSFWGSKLNKITFSENTQLQKIGINAFGNNSYLNVPELPLPVLYAHEFVHWKDGVDSVHNATDEITNNETSYEAVFEMPENTTVLSSTGNLDFREVAIGQTNTLTIEVHNSGNSSLLIQRIELPDGYTSDWLNGIIEANTKQAVAITFSPTEEKTYLGKVTVVSQATFGNADLPIGGIGVLEALESIQQPPPINLAYSSPMENIPFPTEIKIITNAGERSLNTSSLNWTTNSYQKYQAGSYTFTSDLAGILQQENIETFGLSTQLKLTVEVSPTTNVPTVSTIRVYPNPTHSQITITGAPIEAIQLFDWNGRIMSTPSPVVNKLNLENYATGMYFLRITTSTGIQNFTISKH